MLPAGAQPVELAAYISKEITMHGSFRFDDEIDRAIELLAEHPEVEAALTHEIPADAAAEAFALAKDSDASGKVLVSLWTDDAPA